MIDSSIIVEANDNRCNQNELEGQQVHRRYLVGLLEGAKRMHMITNNMKASKVQKAGIIQALRHDSLRGSLALKYN